MRKHLLFTLVILLAWLCFVAAAWSRVGGGQSYSGGSRSSSHSSSGGSFHSSGFNYSSSGSSIPLPAPCVVVLVLMVVAYVAYDQLRKQRDSQGTSRAIEELTAKHAADQRTPEELAEGLERIVQRDPAFTPQEFLPWAGTVFTELQQAWSTGNFEPVRRFVSDGVLRRFTVQIALNRFYGKRNVTTDVRLLDTVLVAVESDDEFDTLHVRFEASARDCDVAPTLSDAEAFQKAARAPSTSFVETWSFLRRLNPAQSKGKLSEGKCPSCGAPVERTASATCDYCKAVLNSGTYDWVLAEITQEGEFANGSPGRLEGFARLKATDPAVSRQALEDRACLVFWKWVEALATGSPRRFARLCTAPALDALASLQDKPSQAFAKAAVGGVELARVDSDAEIDRASFVVRWSNSGAQTGIVHTSVLTLARQAGIKTNAKTGLSTDRCHRCAAIQTDSEAVECSHCGALLTQDWAFEELISLEAFEARRRTDGQDVTTLSARLGLMADPRERLRALGLMVAMARADGVVTRKEKRLLELCARRWSIDPVRLQALLAAPAEELSNIAPRGVDESGMLFRALVAAALVDGKIDSSERKLLNSMASHLHLASDDAKAIFQEMKAQVEVSNA